MDGIISQYEGWWNKIVSRRMKAALRIINAESFSGKAAISGD
jgi:hypothetical protein